MTVVESVANSNFESGEGNDWTFQKVHVQRYALTGTEVHHDAHYVDKSRHEASESCMRYFSMIAKFLVVQGSLGSEFR